MFFFWYKVLLVFIMFFRSSWEWLVSPKRFCFVLILGVSFPNVRKHLMKIEREIASDICGFWIDCIIHHKRKIIHNMVRTTITIIADSQLILTCAKSTTETLKTLSSKLTIKTPERRHWRGSSVFVANFEHISHLFLEFLLWTLN